MEWSFRDCEVIITIVAETPRETLKPFVEIFCKDDPAKQTMLTTGKSFASAIIAERCGQNMARSWIDENRRNEEDPRA